MAKATGGNATAGAIAAASGTKWNKYERVTEILEQLNELNESEEYKELKDGEYFIRYGTMDGEKVAVAIDKDGKVFDLEVIHDAGIDRMMLHGNPLMKKGEVYTIDKMDHYGELNAQKTGEQAVFKRGDADGHIISLLTFADREAINRVLFAPLFQIIEFREKVSQFNKGFIKSIAKNFTPDFQFDPYNNPAKKHYTFETRAEILGEIAGDVVSSDAGAAMFFGGASAATGGSAAAALTGVGITITPAVAATGATVAIYGGATAAQAGQNLVEDISRFKASTSGNGSATPPKLDTAESAVEKLDVPGISRFIRTEKNVPARLPAGKPAGADKNLSPAGVALDENRSVNKVLEEAKEGRKTKGPARQYEKAGGYEQAEKDFYSLDLEEGSVRDRTDEKGKIKTGRLRDGREVNVREGSMEGHPTLEIINSKNSRTKIRYSD